MEFRPVRPDEIEAAARCYVEPMLGREASAKEVTGFVRNARAAGTDLTSQLAAVDEDGTVVAAVLFALTAEGAVTAAAPSALPSYEHARDVRVKLLQALRLHCMKLKAWTVQVFCEAQDERTHALLMEAGYEDLAVMQFMERAILQTDRELSLAFDDAVRWLTWDEAGEDRFVQLVQKTYEGTLDCPGLTNRGDVKLRLGTYRRSGPFEPSLWTLAEIDGVDAGCVLLMRTAGVREFELSYVGVVPSQRGRGVGRLLMHRALKTLAERYPGTQLKLAVDESNVPAVRLYDELGFDTTGRRRVCFSLLAHV